MVKYNKPKLWFKGFKRTSGFSKEFSVEKNLETMYKNSGLKDPVDKYLRIGRQSNALANLTVDKETKRIARAVATLAFSKLARLHELGK